MNLRFQYPPLPALGTYYRAAEGDTLAAIEIGEHKAECRRITRRNMNFALGLQAAAIALTAANNLDNGAFGKAVLVFQLVALAIVLGARAHLIRLGRA